MKKYIKKISIFIILLIISLTAVFYVKADSGWDSDYGGGSDWGGSDWGGSSYDSGSSWSSSDYGSSSHSRYDSSSGYSSKTYTYGRADKLKVFLLFLFIIGSYLFIPGLVILISFLFGDKHKNNINIKSFNNYYDVTDELFKKYFDCDINSLKKKLYNKFCDIQIDWMNFDYDNLRKLCTDELYNQYKTLLETSKLKNEQNIMKDFCLNSIKIYNISEINGIVRVNVFLDVTFKDYVINCETNKIVRGDDKIIFNNVYLLEFVKGKDSKVISCPSCGAVVDVISSNVCSHCKNTIVNTSNELVLSKKKIVSSIKTHS